MGISVSCERKVLPGKGRFSVKGVNPFTKETLKDLIIFIRPPLLTLLTGIFNMNFGRANITITKATEITKNVSRTQKSFLPGSVWNLERLEYGILQQTERRKGKVNCVITTLAKRHKGNSRESVGHVGEGSRLNHTNKIILPALEKT